MSIAEKLTTIAENMQYVYDEGWGVGYDDGYDLGYGDGYGLGYADGHTEGIEEGKQAQWSDFWDNFQQNGNRTDYSYAFCNWDKFEQCFKPKYDIKPTGSIASMFRSSRQYVSVPTLCEQAGITLDFSKVTSFSNFLYDTAFYRVGIIDCSSATTLSSAFNGATSLNTIDKLIVHEGITTYADCFANTSQLKDITIEGTIAGTGIYLSAHTQLTHDSIMSFIYALKDYSGTTTTKTITFGKTNLAKLTDAEKAIATEKGWTLA